MSWLTELGRAGRSRQALAPSRHVDRPLSIASFGGFRLAPGVLRASRRARQLQAASSSRRRPRSRPYLLARPLILTSWTIVVAQADRCIPARVAPAASRAGQKRQSCSGRGPHDDLAVDSPTSPPAAATASINASLDASSLRGLITGGLELMSAVLAPAGALCELTSGEAGEVLAPSVSTLGNVARDLSPSSAGSSLAGWSDTGDLAVLLPEEGLGVVPRTMFLRQASHVPAGRGRHAPLQKEC